MTATICFNPKHELPCRHETGVTCNECSFCESRYIKPADRTILVPMTYDQLVLVESALEAQLYEDAPERARNQGFALDPDDEEDGVEIDEDDEEEVNYRETYRATRQFEHVLARAKTDFRS